MKTEFTFSLPKVLLAIMLFLQHTPVAGQELDLLYTLSIDWNWCLSFGRAVSSVGDIDGDSVWDIAVGLEYDFPNEVYLFSGANGHLLDSLYSPNTGHRFGWSVCGIGEPNHEGHRPLLVSAIQEEPDTCPTWWDSGRAYLFCPGTGELTHSFESPNPEEDGLFGWCLSAVPGLDGVGTAGLAIGTPWESPGASPDQAGRVSVFSGSTGDLVYELASPNEEFAGFFGCSIAGLEDVDGDGVGEVAVGAYGEDSSNGFIDAGRVYLFSGAAGEVLRVLSSPQAEWSGYFGWSISPAGDVNGDGVMDVLIGAPWEDPGDSPGFSGRAYVFSGCDGELIYSLQSPNEEWHGHFGETVASTGDIDGDGIDDLVVGAPFENPDGSPQDAGRVYVFSGASAELLQVISSPTQERYGRFGAAISGLSPEGRAGFPQLIVGAPGEWQTGPDDWDGRGRVYVWGQAVAADPIPAGPRECLRLQILDNPVTTFPVRFRIENSLVPDVQVSIYDLCGRRVNVLCRESSRSRGDFLIWNGRRGDGSPVSNGVYFVRAEGGCSDVTARLVVIR